MNSRIPKKIASLGLAFAIVSATGINVWAQDIGTASVNVLQREEEMELPTITTHNIQMLTGNIQNLVVNEGYKVDNDFNPNIASQDAYFEFSYPQTIDFTGVQLVGWWPNEQGIKTIAFEYHDGKEWKQCSQNIEINWQTPGGSSGPEPLLLTLDTPVTGNKFRVRVIDTYRAWSNKCSMRLIKPVGTVAEGSINKRPLFELIKVAESCVQDVLVGTEEGAFPESAVAQLEQVTESVKQMMGDLMTPEDFDAQMNRLQEAILAFQNSQNPISPSELRPVITVQGMDIKGGKVEALLDNQLSTFVRFEQAGILEEAYVNLDFREKVFALEALELIISNPTEAGFINIDLECLKEGQWISVAQNVPLNWNWKGYFGTSSVIYQGEGVELQAPVKASQFRVKLNQTVAGASESQLNEIRVKGTFAVDKSVLQQLISEGEKLLQEEIAVPLQDWLKLSIQKGKYLETLKAATENQVEEATQQLKEIISLITGTEEIEWIQAQIEGEETVEGGQSIIWDMFLEPENEPIFAIDFKLTYDEQLVEPKLISQDETIRLLGTQEEEGKLRVLVASTEPITQRVKILELQFETKEQETSQSTSVGLIEGTVGIVVDGKEKILPIKKVEKSLLIKAENRDEGDINQDGEVDVADLAAVSYYYGANKDSDNWGEAQKVDVHKDGKIDIQDLSVVANRILNQ